MYKTLILSLALVGCGEAPEADDEVPVVEGKADSLSFLPAPADTADRLYFDTTQTASIDGPHYWVFTARANHSFTVTEQTLDPNSDEGAVDTKGKPGFKLYRLARSNHYYWKLVKQVDGKKGVASVSYKGETSRYYLLEASAASFPSEISVALSCAGGDHKVCALGGQPRDLCGTRGAQACDSGLYCAFDVGSCGADDRGGECTVQPSACPPMGIACFPVCGCDGTTYCMGCDVNQHGVSIAHQGSCDCDPNQYEDSDTVSPSGSYQFIDTGKTHYTYTFSGRGGFTSERDPGCMFSNPRCLIAVMPRHGVYSVNGDDTVTLSYDDGTTATLITQTNCEGTDRLYITDFGVSFFATHLN